MKTVCAQDMCCGCMACFETCHKGAIDIVDSLRAFNAMKNDNCVECGLCERVCPQNNPPISLEPIAWNQGWANEDHIRTKASSGGYASAISYAFVRQGGIVCSCKFESGGFGFKYAKTIDELKGFEGSKYVKSNPKNIYVRLVHLLKDGKRVLFIGLPCQVAGVKNYVGKKLLDNLYTIDLICHGTPSPQVLEKFFNDHSTSLNDISSISFRHKARFAVYKNHKSMVPRGNVDSYTIAFHHGYSYTNNCYECQYAKKTRVSDVTLGDAWGTQLSKLSFRKGVSLALCQTEKGIVLLNMADIEAYDINLDDAIHHNAQLNAPSPRPHNWEAFFNDMKKGVSFDRLVRKYMLKAYLRQVIKYICIKLHIIRWGGEFIKLNIRTISVKIWL